MVSRFAYSKERARLPCVKLCTSRCAALVVLSYATSSIHKPCALSSHSLYSVLVPTAVLSRSESTRAVILHISPLPRCVTTTVFLVTHSPMPPVPLSSD